MATRTKQRQADPVRATNAHMFIPLVCGLACIGGVILLSGCGSGSGTAPTNPPTSTAIINHGGTGTGPIFNQGGSNDVQPTPTPAQTL